jgi:hypothetical protein
MIPIPLPFGAEKAIHFPSGDHRGAEANVPGSSSVTLSRANTPGDSADLATCADDSFARIINAASNISAVSEGGNFTGE